MCFVLLMMISVLPAAPRNLNCKRFCVYLLLCHRVPVSVTTAAPLLLSRLQLLLTQFLSCCLVSEPFLNQVLKFDHLGRLLDIVIQKAPSRNGLIPVTLLLVTEVGYHRHAHYLLIDFL